MTRVTPSPTLGNCTELLLHQKLSNHNLHARRRVKTYLDNIIKELPYDRLRNFLSKHSIGCTVPEIDNVKLFQLFLEDQDYFFKPDLLDEVKRQHEFGLVDNGKKVRKLSDCYYDWVERQTGSLYADLSTLKKMFDAIHLLVVLHFRFSNSIFRII